jgi:hypothetical protein
MEGDKILRLKKYQSLNTVEWMINGQIISWY